MGLILVLGVFEKGAQGPAAARAIRTVSDSFDFSEFHVAVAEEAERAGVFPYSVIPGGVRDREELADSVERDPVVARHYANFKVADARIVRVQGPQSVHVSYRIQDKIFWTAKKITLFQGEKLISDGQTLARTRCGNQVSAVPQEPVSAVEPPPELFDTPVIAIDVPLLSETIPPPSWEFPLQILEPMVSPPDLVTLENRFFEDVIIPYGPTPYFPPIYIVDELPRVSEVPEPATLIMIISGLAILVLWRLRAKRAST